MMRKGPNNIYIPLKRTKKLKCRVKFQLTIIGCKKRENLQSLNKIMYIILFINEELKLACSCPINLIAYNIGILVCHYFFYQIFDFEYELGE